MVYKAVLFLLAADASSFEDGRVEKLISTEPDVVTETQPIRKSQIEFNGSVLGSGSFASVSPATLMNRDSSRESVVIKTMRKRTLRELEKLYINELDILTQMQSLTERESAEQDHQGRDYIVQLIGSFEDVDKMYIVLEPLGLDLFHVTTSDIPLHLDDLREILRQTLHAIDYCHMKGVIHCDIKLENVLLAASGPLKHGRDGRITNLKIKLIDFGLSKRVGDGRLDKYGTFAFLSPEVVLSIPRTAKLDMWGIGHLAFTLRTCRDMFGYVDDDDYNRLLVMMQKVRWTGIPKSMFQRSADRSRFRKWILESSESTRPWAIDNYIICGCEDVKNTEAEGLVDLIHCLMEFDPDRRPSAKEALIHPFLRIKD